MLVIKGVADTKKECFPAKHVLDAMEHWVTPWSAEGWVLTRLSHIHELDSVLYASFSVSGEMDGSEAALSNFFVHLVVVQNCAVIKSFP